METPSETSTIDSRTIFWKRDFCARARWYQRLHYGRDPHGQIFLVIPKTTPTNGNFTTAQNFAAADNCVSPSEHVLDGLKWATGRTGESSFAIELTITPHYTITDTAKDIETKPMDEEASVLKAHYVSGIGRHPFSTDRTKEPTNDDTKKEMKHGWQHLHRAGNQEQDNNEGPI